MQKAKQHKCRDARHQHAQGEVDIAEMQARPDITCFDVPVIDAENQNEHNLGYKQQSEKESETAQRFLAPFFKGHVIDLVNEGAEHIECRQHHEADQDRVEAERDIDNVGDVRTKDNESRMRDIDDVEHSEGYRNTGGDSGIKATEQKPGDDSVDQEIERNIHTAWPGIAPTSVAFAPAGRFSRRYAMAVIRTSNFAGVTPL